LIGSVLLFVWAWRVYSKGNPIRLAAGFTLLFTLTEAIVGAGLVLFELVANNASLIRAASVAIHLVNTLILLGFLTLTAWLSSGGQVPRWKGHQRIGVILGIALLGAILLCASGAVTALGDTLFPSESLSEGLAQDISPTANFLIRLRVYHPIIAITVGTYLLISILWTGLEKVASPFKRMSMLMIGLFAIQLVLGLTNVFLLAPVWLQLVHLFVSDLVWIALVILTLVHLSQPLPEAYQVNPHLLRSAPE
jgi:heme A synthase